MNNDQDNLSTNQATVPRDQAPERPANRPFDLPTQASASPSRGIIQADDAPAAASPRDAGHEGRPNSKMGATYVPSADEDHTTKAHDIGERTDHSADMPAPTAPPTLPSVSGSTNPEEPIRQG